MLDCGGQWVNLASVIVSFLSFRSTDLTKSLLNFLSLIQNFFLNCISCLDDMPQSIPGVEVFVNVLIVGAGPTGLMAATTLTRYGVDVRIIDKRSSRVQAGHAHCRCCIYQAHPFSTNTNQAFNLEHKKSYVLLIFSIPWIRKGTA